MLLCVVKKKELTKALGLIKECDERAFVIIGDARKSGERDLPLCRKKYTLCKVYKTCWIIYVFCLWCFARNSVQSEKMLKTKNPRRT